MDMGEHMLKGVAGTHSLVQILVSRQYLLCGWMLCCAGPSAVPPVKQVSCRCLAWRSVPGCFPPCGTQCRSQQVCPSPRTKDCSSCGSVHVLHACFAACTAPCTAPSGLQVAWLAAQQPLACLCIKLARLPTQQPLHAPHRPWHAGFLDAPGAASSAPSRPLSLPHPNVTLVFCCISGLPEMKVQQQEVGLCCSIAV